jgi:uncharacterized membrane protein
MTAETVGAPQQRLTVAQAIGVVGCSIVLLLATAALVNQLLSGEEWPEGFRQIAITTHFAAIFAVLPLTIIQVLMPKGTLPHRVIGYAWCALMVAAALVSFGIHELTGGFSPPHIFSIATLIVVPLIIYFARQGRVKSHRAMIVTMMFTLIFAGSLTFIPGRVIGTLFWSIWS